MTATVSAGTDEQKVEEFRYLLDVKIDFFEDNVDEERWIHPTWDRLRMEILFHIF